MPASGPPVPYEEVLEATGFYRGGQPLGEAMWSASDPTATIAPQPGAVALDSERVERTFRYQAVVRPEAEGGKLGIADVFELSGSPCIYFKHLSAEPEAQELTPRLLRWQRAAWNHGRAPMLWVVTPTQVRILNAYARPPAPEEAEEEAEDALGRVEIARFERIADHLKQLKAVASRQAIESGDFWAGSGKGIAWRSRVDRELVRDLNSAAQQLEGKGLDLGEAHRLLLRGIFASYLESRGWLPPRVLSSFGVASFRDALARPGSAEDLFDWLAETFNGDVFPTRRTRRYSAGQLRELKFLLEAGDPKSRQTSLWPYEFDVVPVELLSSIYEEFAHALDRARARRQSTHYTPVNLVDLTLSEVFNDGLFRDKLPLDAKALDLACGSGVFLVECLRRLVARRVAAGEPLTRPLVRDTLYSQIYGVDANPGAIHIAAVSLYLAALDLDPDPGVGNGVRFRPLIAHPPEVSEPRTAGGHNLFAADAFDPDPPFRHHPAFSGKQFAVVVGNPPWTRPAGERAERAEGEPKRVGAPPYVNYCRERSIPLPSQDPPDQAFVWRAADFLSGNGRIGMLLSARRFFSHHEDSVAARAALLRRFAPRMMVNLSSLSRESLFPEVKYPAMVYVAPDREAQPGDSFTLVAVERSRTFHTHGAVEVGPELVKQVSVSRAIRQEDLLKVASWGSARDMEVISHLQEGVALGKVQLAAGIEFHHGFIRGKEKNRTMPVPKCLRRKRCLEKIKDFRPFAMSTSHLGILKDRKMQWPRDPEIYRGPILLFNLSLSQRVLHCTFCKTLVVYSDRFCGLPISPQIQRWARCLNVILNSRLATYFFFLTAPVWGVERDSLKEEDLLRLPMPPPLDDTTGSTERLVDLEARLAALSKKGTVPPSALSELNDAVYDLYGLDSRQRLLIEDMLDYTIDLQLRKERSTALRPATVDDLGAYASQFMAVVDEFLSVRNKSELVAEPFELPTESRLRVVKFRTVARSARIPKVRPVACEALDRVLDQIAEVLLNQGQSTDPVYTRRHLRVYGPGEVYIVKPAQVRFWTRSAGLNDADAVLAEHLGAR